MILWPCMPLAGTTIFSCIANRSPLRSNQSPQAQPRNFGHLKLTTGDRGPNARTITSTSVSACPKHEKAREIPPQMRAFLRRPARRQNYENAWLTRQSHRTSLRVRKSIYREKTGKILKTRREYVADPHQAPSKPPKIRACPALFPVIGNRELTYGKQGIGSAD